MFYEFQHSFNDEHFTVFSDENLSYPPHLHSSFEFILCTGGEMEIKIDSSFFTIRGGEAVLIFPNQVHELKTPESSSHTLCIFSPTLVKSYTAITRGEIPTDNFLCPNRSLNAIFQEFDKNGDSRTLLEIKAALYSLCAEFDKNRGYSAERKNKNELLGKIFAFLDYSYKKECNLENLAQSLGYNYVYLSRFFKEAVGISFTEYVNRCRISEAQYLLKNTKSSILGVAMDCGFNSLRTFNRNFKELVGISPIEYRKK